MFPKKNLGLQFSVARKNNFVMISETVEGICFLVLVTDLGSYSTQKSEVTCPYCPLSLSAGGGNMV